MKLSDIARRVGAGLVRELVPGGGAIVSVVNALLPQDKQLPPDATGDQLAAVVPDLPPEVQLRELDVQALEVQQQGDTLRAMLDADMRSPHTTRPYIAKHAFHVCAVAILATVAAWVWGIASDNTVMVAAVIEGWPFVLSVTGPLFLLLRSYFGVLRAEQANRLAAAQGSTPPGLAAILGQIVGNKKR